MLGSAFDAAIDVMTSLNWSRRSFFPDLRSSPNVHASISRTIRITIKITVVIVVGVALRSSCCWFNYPISGFDYDQTNTFSISRAYDLKFDSKRTLCSFFSNSLPAMLSIDAASVPLWVKICSTFVFHQRDNWDNKNVPVFMNVVTFVDPFLPLFVWNFKRSCGQV